MHTYKSHMAKSQAKAKAPTAHLLTLWKCSWLTLSSIMNNNLFLLETNVVGQHNCTLCAQTVLWMNTFQVHPSLAQVLNWTHIVSIIPLANWMGCYGAARHDSLYSMKSSGYSIKVWSSRTVCSGIVELHPLFLYRKHNFKSKSQFPNSLKHSAWEIAQIISFSCVNYLRLNKMTWCSYSK